MPPSEIATIAALAAAFATPVAANVPIWVRGGETRGRLLLCTRIGSSLTVRAMRALHSDEWPVWIWLLSGALAAVPAALALAALATAAVAVAASTTALAVAATTATIATHAAGLYLRANHGGRILAAMLLGFVHL